MHVELTSRRADKQTSDSRTASLKLSLIQKHDVGCPVPLAGLFATNYTICGRNGCEGSSDGQQQPGSSQQEHHREFSESERKRIILLYRGKIPCVVVPEMWPVPEGIFLGRGARWSKG